MILSYCTLASELEKSGMGHLSVEWYQRAYQVASKLFLENAILQELKKLIDLSASANIVSASPHGKESKPLSSSRRETPSKNIFTGNGDDYDTEDRPPQIPSKNAEELIAVDKVSIRARPRSALPRLLKEKDDILSGNYDETPPNPVKVATSHKPFQQENTTHVVGIAANDGHDYYDVPRPKSAISKLGGSYNGPPSHSNHGVAGFSSPNSKVSRMENAWYYDNTDEDREVLMVDEGQIIAKQDMHSGYRRHPSPPPPQSPQLHARYDKYFPKGGFGAPVDKLDYDSSDPRGVSSNHRRSDGEKTNFEAFHHPNGAAFNPRQQREDSPASLEQQPQLYSSISTPLLLNPSHHSIVLLPSHSLTQLNDQKTPRKNHGPPKHPLLPRKTLASELLAKKKRSERKSNEDYVNHHEDGKIKSSRTLHSSSDLPSKGNSNEKSTTATTSKQNKTPLSKMLQESSHQQLKRPSSSPSPSRKHQNQHHSTLPGGGTSTPHNLTVSRFHIHNNPLLQIDEFGKEKIKKIADYCFPYFKGLRIEAKYQISRIGDRGKWYPGRIIKIDFLNGLYDIEFENGDKEKNISVENIRIPEYASKLELLQSTTKALLSSTKGGGNSKSIEEDHRLSEKEKDKGEGGIDGEKKGKKNEINIIPSKLLRKQFEEEMHISTLKLLAGINQRSEQRKIERLLLKNLLITKIQSLIRGILLRKRFPKIRQQLMKEKQLRKKERDLRHMEQQLMNNHQNGFASSSSHLFGRPQQLTTIEVQTGQSLFEEEYDDHDQDEQERRKQHSSPLNIHPTHSYLETPVATDHNGGYYPDEEDGRAEVSVKYGKFLNENDGSPILFGQGEGHPGFKGANSDSDIILIPMDHLQQRPFFDEKFAEIEKINVALLQIQEEQKGFKELDLQRNQELLKQFHQLHSLLLSQTEELRQIKQQETTKMNTLQKSTTGKTGATEKKESSEADSDNSQVIDRIMSNEYHPTFQLKEEKSVARKEEKEMAIVNHTVTFSNPPAKKDPATSPNLRMKISLPSSNLNENSIGMEVSIENSVLKSEDMRLVEEFGQLGVEDFWNSVSTTDFPLMPKSNYRQEIEQPSTVSNEDSHIIPRIMEELTNEAGDVTDTPEKRSTPSKSDGTSNGNGSHQKGDKPVTPSSGKSHVGNEGSIDFDEIDRSLLGNSKTSSPTKKSHRKNGSPRKNAADENKDPLHSPNLSTEDCCNPY
jgi:hypothetical protein